MFSDRFESKEGLLSSSVLSQQDAINEIIANTAEDFEGALEKVSPELAEEVRESQSAVAECMRNAEITMLSDNTRYL